MSEHSLYWRVGRSIGRTIYAVTFDDEGNEQARLIGLMDSPLLASEAVTAHNERRARLLSAHGDNR